MKKVTVNILSVLMAFVLFASSFSTSAYAAEITDEAVLEVIAQLEAVDTLKQMQDKRSEYAVNSRYNAITTDNTIISDHENARAEYEAYVEKMFAARLAAQQAYDVLTTEQKSLISVDLVEKLNNELDTVFRTSTFSLTPRNDEYSYEVVTNNTSGGLVYETSNHVTLAPEIPATFILVNTSDGKTNWTPSGRYACGESNYEVAYCCDVATKIKYGSHYKRINLEDSSYYGDAAARHIRGILQNAYPFISMEEMKKDLIAGGLKEDYVNQLNRSDIIAAVQMAVWAYANTDYENIKENVVYGASYDIPSNASIYYNPLHDHTNELWDWWTTSKRQISYDARAEYRVNTLVHYLCNLGAEAPAENQIVISDVEIARADLLPGTDDTYQVGMYIYLNHGGQENNDLKVKVTSYQTGSDGSVSTTAQINQRVSGRKEIEMTIRAKAGDEIKVVVEGTQTIAKGVYFYEAEGGREASQNLVGVSGGKANVKAEETFTFEEKAGESGLRIYKTEKDTGLPLSEITFHIYNVDVEEGTGLSETPTKEEIDKYGVEANIAASVTTDETGYASVALENGTYLIIEEHNTEKIIEPVEPFYITIPMNIEKENEDGTTGVETISVVSVYPKNEPVIPPEVPPVIPPTPDNVTGRFQILKYGEGDKNMVLSGAEFEVYRPAAETDTDTVTIVCDGIQYAAVPVMADGKKLVLKTDDNGKASSPELTCGTYFLVEIKAPAGYNQLDQAVEVTVLSNEMTTVTTVEIANERGIILPETGGVGTKWFIRIGSLMVLAAVVLLVTRKRMSYNE